MHDFLRAIGFSRIRDKWDLMDLIDEVNSSPDNKYSADIAEREGILFGERSRDFAENAGVAIRGEYFEDEDFSCEYYFPYYTGHYVSMTDELTVEKLVDKEDYDGIVYCTEQGVSLIFHLNRLGDIAGSELYFENEKKVGVIENAKIRLSALSVSGKVLIPLYRSDRQIIKRRREIKRRSRIIEAARGGSREAINNLTIERLDTYAQAIRRLGKEDVLSIVESYVMPYSISCDQYSVLGDIVDLNECINGYTGERLCQLTVNCNGLPIDICMNRADLEGVPQVGRRFLGNIWLQATVD